MLVKAKESLLGNGKVYISKGKNYEAERKFGDQFVIINDLGEEEVLSEETIHQKFEVLKVD